MVVASVKSDKCATLVPPTIRPFAHLFSNKALDGGVAIINVANPQSRDPGIQGPTNIERDTLVKGH